jgi:hypothetical protein
MRDGVIEPLLDEHADQVAAGLGIPGFEDDSTGTSLAVIGMHGVTEDGDPRSAVECMEVMAEAIAWHCWPKFGLGEVDEVTFSVKWNGDEVLIPGGQEIPVLNSFRSALLDVVERDENGGETVNPDVRSIDSQRPLQHLGLLGVRHSPYTRTTYEHRVAAISGPSHHVALMRHPRIVVKYFEGPRLRSEHVQWAGVFHASDESDEAFARAEPPTHDDWVSDGLEKPDRTYVNVMYTRLAEKVREILAPGSTDDPRANALPLGALSSRLGSLIASAQGTGGRLQPRMSRTTLTSRKLGGVSVLTETLVDEDGPTLIVEFEADPANTERVLEVRPKVLVDAGRAEHDPPAKATLPSVKEFVVNGDQIDGLTTTIRTESRGRVSIRVPDDTMVRAEISMS